MIKAWKLVLIIGYTVLVAACDDENANLSTLKVGVYATEIEEVSILNVVKKSGRANGLNITPVVYKDYHGINAALCIGDIDANIFQTLPYLAQQTQTDPSLQQVMQSTHCQLEIVGKTFILPMGLYSRKITNVNQLQPQSVVAIPDQPVNGSRALLLLQKVGLIGLRPGAGPYATVDDVVSNPLQLVIVPMIPEQLPSVIAAASLLALDPTVAAEGGFSIQNAFALDNSPQYAVLIVARKTDASDVQYAQLVATYHSSEVVTAMENLTGGAAVPAWDTSNQLPGRME